MEEYYHNKKLFTSLNLDFFLIEKLNIGLVLLKVNLQSFKTQDTELLINTISVLISEGHNNLLVDFTETQTLDTFTITKLFEKIAEITEIGGSIRFLVTEDNPKMKLLPKEYNSKFNVYLNMNSVVQDFNI
jgi:hypothetical protein